MHTLPLALVAVLLTALASQAAAATVPMNMCYEKANCTLPCTFGHVDWNTGVLYRLPKYNGGGVPEGGGGFYEEPHVGQSQGSSTGNLTEWYTDDPEYRAIGIMQVRWISKGKLDIGKGGVQNGEKGATNRWLQGKPQCALFQVMNPTTNKWGNIPKLAEIYHPDSEIEIGDRCFGPTPL